MTQRVKLASGMQELPSRHSQESMHVHACKHCHAGMQAFRQERMQSCSRHACMYSQTGMHASIQYACMLQVGMQACRKHVHSRQACRHARRRACRHPCTGSACRHSHEGLHAGTPRQRNAVFAEKFPHYLVLMKEVGQLSPTCEGYFYTIGRTVFAQF